MQINGATQIVGLFGWPVSHSLSPAMHNAAFAQLGLNWAYIPLPLAPEQVGQAIPSLQTFNFKGANVTIPHKQAVMRYLDHIDPAAQAIGAVNTIALKDDGVHGYNTDEYGFLQPLLNTGFQPKNTHCLILGAGGAARATVFSLANAGAKSITVCNRTVERAAFLVDDLHASFPQVRLSSETLSQHTLKSVGQRVDLVVNTTSVGMSPQTQATPWPDDVPLPPALIYDLVYNPPETHFLQQAKAAGLQVIDGLDMLVYQGAKSFEIWTGQTPPIDLMRRMVIEGLEKR
jgi:shikimate dehydrogenase